MGTCEDVCRAFCCFAMTCCSAASAKERKERMSLICFVFDFRSLVLAQSFPQARWVRRKVDLVRFELYHLDDSEA